MSRLAFLVLFLCLTFVSSMPSSTSSTEEEDDEEPPRADDEERVYKNPRNSPSAQCPRDEEQATLLGQKCLRKCSSDEDCKSKKKKCLCDGACGMSCIKPDRECPELEQPDIGKVALSGRLFGDKAVYTCPHGYHVVGLQSRSCQADGQWAGQPPACKENIYCLFPPVIEHARHSALPEQGTFDLDATVQYNCLNGYVTNGFPRAKCLAIDGQASWYGPDISCEPRSCGEPGDVPHGWITADCHTYNCRATVQCGQGFELVGKVERHCQADGTWTPKELPTCVLVTQVQCPPPEAPRHGKAVYTSCAYNSVVSYECKYGYHIVGNATRRCGADKRWSGMQPSCKEINCGHPGQLWNGWLENISLGTGLGASIIFRCQDGMKMEGNGSAVCQPNGTWSHPLPKCLAPCVVPHVSQGGAAQVNRTNASLTHAVGSSTMVQHGDIIIVDCETNYEFPSDNASVTCNNGTWTQIPRCQPARCKKLPPAPRNGMVIAPRTEHGMRARYRCKDGFKLAGGAPGAGVVCSYGVWSGERPRCEEVFCPFPGFVENGKVLLVGNMGLYDYRPYVKKVVNNKQIMYECEKGYVLSEGPPGATCIGGHWSPRELPKCTLYQHPRIRWSRRRRSLPESTLRLPHQPPWSQASLYRTQHKPTLRHANYKLMKKIDLDFDDGAEAGVDLSSQDVPTAIYTMYRGQPVSKLLSYQPSYDPDNDEVDHDYEASDSFENTPSDSMVVLKGGMFPEHELMSYGSSPVNINRLKQDYFEKYVDRRQKRFSNQMLKGYLHEFDMELESSESKQDPVKHRENRAVDDVRQRVNRAINANKQNIVESDAIKHRENREGDGNHREKRAVNTINNTNDITESDDESLRVIPLKGNDRTVYTPEYRSTNSTEYNNILDKKDKRSGGKTGLNTTDSVPKNGGDSKADDSSEENQTAEKEDPGNKNEDVNEKGKRPRPKSPCEPLQSEPYVNIEVVKFGRDPNNTFSSGTILRVACGGGYVLSLEPNATAKCVRGRWRPARPECRAKPCYVPSNEYGIYTLAPPPAGVTRPPGGPGVAGVAGGAEERELNETEPVPNGQVVNFSCEYGYSVVGPTNLRCWLGAWAVTSMPDCAPAPCELPSLQGATYSQGYRAGLTVAHGARAALVCERGRAPPAALVCRLGRLLPTVPDFCRPMANHSRPRPTSEYQSGSDILKEESQLEPEVGLSADCGPPTRVQGTLVYRDGAEVNQSLTTLGAEGYPHGTEVTFSCIASIMGERTTWKVICEQGNWVGRSVNCEELESSLEQANSSCTLEPAAPHVATFYHDLEVTEPVELPAGAVVMSRCSDIGKYALVGARTRRCARGAWDAPPPHCEGLNQESDFAMEKPPTILFRYSGGPVAQTPAGRLLLYPGVTLHMECLWMRRFGNPKWNYTLATPGVDKKYPEGWSSDPGRDPALEYRLTLPAAAPDDAGVFRCETPARQAHEVEIVVEAVHCPELPRRRGLAARGAGTRLGTTVSFSCDNGNALIGAAAVVCRASGNWSAPVPVCESVECGEVPLPPAPAGGRAPRVGVVSRGVGGRAAFSCPAGWALQGAAETVCLADATWAGPFPVCKEVSCPALPPPAFGYVLGRAPYRAGDVLQLHCDPEHTLLGRPILVCQDSGRWSDRPPTCAQACTYPGTAIAGRMSSVKFYYRIGESVTFTCEPGYRLRGAPMLKCLKNRKWSNAIPLCAPVSNLTGAEPSPGDAALADRPFQPADILRTRETPAILSPESYKAAITRVAASRLLRRSPIETYKMRVSKVNQLLRRDTDR